MWKRQIFQIGNLFNFYLFVLTMMVNGNTVIAIFYEHFTCLPVTVPNLVSYDRRAGGQ